MADELTIITNHVPRLILEAYELSAKERAEFDYLDWDAIERGEESASFIRYKGTLYDLGDLERADLPPYHPLAQWDAFVSDTFFSGVVFRYVKDDYDHVICGRYYS